MKKIGMLLVVAASFGAAFAGGRTSERFAFATYREDVNRITVLVDAAPAAWNNGEAFIPLHIAVGMDPGRKSVQITPESFRLVDATGKAVAAAGYQELARGYRRVGYDMALIRQRPLVVGNLFGTRRVLQANFYPIAQRGLRTEQVELAPGTWFHDVIYFPRPAAGIGGVMTLQLSGNGIEVPIEVRFRVPGPAGRDSA
ncbi:MAG: hypothetical protein KBD01_00325 [Acidobacteria bacterium]|nr:hypothetical protein [Acidobacteriota bacterium]